MRYFVVAGAVLLTVIVVRIAWVMTAQRRRRCGRSAASDSIRRGPTSRPTVARRPDRLVVRHARHRLAGRGARPAGRSTATAFPYRDLIVLTAFAVVLGTLVVQGLTLRPLSGRSTCTTTIPSGGKSTRRASARWRPRWRPSTETSPAAEAVREELAAHLSQRPRARRTATRLVARRDPPARPPRPGRRLRDGDGTRSATTRFTGWKRSSTGSRWERSGARSGLIRRCQRSGSGRAGPSPKLPAEIPVPLAYREEGA